MCKAERPRVSWHPLDEFREGARLILYFMSDDADDVTGQSFTIETALR